MTDDLFDLSLSDIAARLSSEPALARNLAEEAIARREAQPEIGTGPYREWRPDIARAMADGAVAALMAGTAGPLAGIPVSVKDLFGVAGTATYAGTPRALPAAFETEGWLVGLLRTQGAIFTGKTHTVEFAFGGLGVNGHWGSVRNPWDPDAWRVSGGSSAGAGVGLAEGSALLALGTDTGGSVRIPAAMTGNVGLKTTIGRWPTTGVVPLSHTLDTVGILTRTVADAAYAFAAIEGTGPVAARPLTGLRIGRIARLAFEDCSPGIAEAVDAGAFGEIRHVLHIGIGGSALGPELVIEALGDAESDYDVAIVSNIDGQALVGPFELFDPAHTLVVLASKSFTTMETMLNAESVIRWMRDGGVADPFGQFVAVTAAPDKAVEFGIDETRVLPFPETVGGRYSLWSSIGFAAALALGWEAFEQLLEGAGAMDRHSRLAEWHENAPAMAAFVDLYYAQRGAETRALFAYDERLRLLPDWLQQLAMESNGKRVTADGDPLGRASSAIVWGGTGTDAQHAVFQLLHQGTHLVPVEFLAVAEPGHDLDPAHHEALLVNCFAQGAALMAGRENADDPARDFPGDRPSTTILLERLDPATLGALLAFYEQRTFVEAVLLGINPFDQYGVELGKDIARAIAADEEQALELDISTKALIERGL
ncbi:amidase family protein [uncultured Parasphingopyxis sp.]|uniref:amidase family protein n=1 Tax=uncultured Parasphingopyxis sp. TaxID=1547918 RepID=UPI0026337D13|nr:amidase family protein [uncultured Parasphingopyxis sp.]